MRETLTTRFRKVAVGGTFGRLHSGHLHLLEKAFDVGDEVIIGLVTDELLKRYPKEHRIASYAYRKTQLLRCLSTLGVAPRASIVPLNDAYGPTTTDGSIEALVVSRETDYRSREINDLRIARGLKPLIVVVVEMVLAEDRLPISTTRIERAEIDRDGHLLHKESSRTIGA